MFKLNTFVHLLFMVTVHLIACCKSWQECLDRVSIGSMLLCTFPLHLMRCMCHMFIKACSSVDAQCMPAPPPLKYSLPPFPCSMAWQPMHVAQNHSHPCCLGTVTCMHADYASLILPHAIVVQAETARFVTFSTFRMHPMRCICPMLFCRL